MEFSLKYILPALTLIFFCGGHVFAQFTIRPKENAEMVLPSSDNSALKGIVLDSHYFDAAAHKAELRRIRKERNTIEFNVAAETSLQQYENWTGSKNNNFHILSSGFFSHQYRKDKLLANYRLEANYGMNVNEGKSFKNKDEFKINAQIGLQAHKYWSYLTSANFRSQFSPGYRSRIDSTLVSNFMAPGYLDIALGLNYSKEGSPFRITLSPLGGNAITVLYDNVAERYGVPDDKRVKWRLGPSIDIFYDQTYGKLKRFRYRSNLYLFSPYMNLIDPMFRWENTLEIRISKYISTKLYLQTYYLREASVSMQYQYSFMIGLKYTFKNK